LVWKYTDDAKKDAEAPFQMQRVLVAAKRVPANTTFSSALDNELIVVEERVEGDLPATRVKEDTDTNLKDSFQSLVASHDISPGQTVVREDFVAQGKALNGLNGQLQSDQDKVKDKTKQLQAVTLTFDDQRAVGGFLQPGDKVNVMWSGAIDKDGLVTGSETVKYTSFLMPGLKVLAVGSTTAAPAAASTASSTDGSPPSTVPAIVSRNLITFEVDSLQASRLVHAQLNGTLYLSLNPSSFKQDAFRTPVEVVEAINLFGQPYGPDLARATQLLEAKSK
jgi:Flp pilus assembly protein CpaB